MQYTAVVPAGYPQRASSIITGCILDAQRASSIITGFMLNAVN